MSYDEAMRACAVGSAVIATGYGMLAVIRSGKWNHPGHWFGILAVLWLASLAWPHHERYEREAQAQAVEKHSAPVSDAIVAALVRFQELKNGKP